MRFENYVSQVDRLYRSGNATEHSYRPALQDCLTGLLKDVQVTNEPKRQECGAPDYILTRKEIPVGFIEAKDLGKSLDLVERGGKDDDQWERYTQSLDNIILTDYLEFRFFRNGEKTEVVKAGEIRNGKVVSLPDNFAHLETLFKDFAAFQGQTIKSARKLAEMMAHKAALMRDVFYKVVKSDEPSTLKDQLAAFKEVLMHDMDEAQFADVYAQTVAYGLFTAKLHDESKNDFSRGEALTLIPKTNPFLQKLFQYVAGADVDDRVIWIVDALCEVYRAADLKLILKDFGSTTGRNDPIIHFYETFLAEYDPKLRKGRGVYYTPEPVVQFIVRAIDDVLKDHFNLKDGLADSSMVKITVDSDRVSKRSGKREKDEIQVHKVQLLDVATGTGTFLAEVIKQIYTRFKGQEGLWGSYVEKDLFPRMHGFEILVASYAMCHMKLDLLLKETGYDSSKSTKRLSVYLTNSLEEHHKDSHLPFANWLSTEANEASRIKRDMPIMIALGNPPYAVSSSNKGEWIQKLLEDYKRDLNERKINLDDDYIKFIRCAEYYIEKNGYGVLAMITNNSFIDGITHRQMRKHLLETFDEIYILDLHGNSQRQEAAIDGSRDENVFDIQQGVSINIMIRTGKSKNLANVYHWSLLGKREEKYQKLSDSNLAGGEWKKIILNSPSYFFVPKNLDSLPEYERGFSVSALFTEYNSGLQTKNDDLCIHQTEDALNGTINDIQNLAVDEIRIKRNIGKDGRDWKLHWAMADIKKGFQRIRLNYKPFDARHTAYTGNSKGFIAYPRERTSRHMLDDENIALVAMRQYALNIPFSYAFATRKLITDRFFLSNKGTPYFFPLYTHEKIGALEEKRPNFNPKIYAAIKKTVPKVIPESLFDYIYAVLHSPAYRKRYAEFLKSDFPCIPYPQDAKTFDALAKLGGEIRALHLLESKTLDRLVTSYPVGGDHEVIKPCWEDTDKKAGLGKVWINPTQYFDRIPKTAWEFYIGGYQPAQKWLKDRQGRALTPDDIRHWQKIIVALVETGRLMQEIDETNFLPT